MSDATNTDGAPATDGPSGLDAGARDGAGDARAACTVPPGTQTLDDAVEVALGPGAFYCVLRGDGTIACWGNNVSGELGADPLNLGMSVAPLTIHFPAEAGALRFTHVSVGEAFACAVDTNQQVWCWGKNNLGQLATGATDTLAHATPTLVLTSNQTPLLAIGLATGAQHACAITIGGDVVCWGDDTNKQLLGGGSSSVPKKMDGVTFSPKGAHIVAPSGGFFTCAFDPSPNIVCWGDDAFGQLQFPNVFDCSIVEQGLEDAGAAPPMVQVSVGPDYACALDSRQKPWCWGSNQVSQIGPDASVGLSTNARPVPVLGLPGGTAREIAAGSEQTCFLSDANGIGGVFCQGYNSIGEVGDITNYPDVTVAPAQAIRDPAGKVVTGAVHIAAGPLESCAILTGPCGPNGPGPLVCWGQSLTGDTGYACGTAKYCRTRATPIPAAL